MKPCLIQTILQTWALHSICGVKGASIFEISSSQCKMGFESTNSPGDTPTPWMCHEASNAIEAKKIKIKLSDGVWSFSSNVVLLFIKIWVKKVEDYSTCSLKFYHKFTLVSISRRWKITSIDKHKHHQF